MVKEIPIHRLGYSVSADWHEGNSTSEVLLILTGWTSNRERYKDAAALVVQNTNMSVLVLEYSGHGDSPIDVNTTRPADHFLEVISAFDWLHDQYPDSKLSVMGTSYGGFLATQLTKYRSFDKLILRAPAIYKPEDFYTLQPDIDREWTFSVFRKDTAALAKHPLLARASSFSGKTLVVIHGNDELCPVETTNAYQKAFSADTYLAEGFPHGVRSMPQERIDKYHTAIIDWLNKN